MNSLSGFNSQEIRRLHPYLSALLRRIEALEAGTGIGGLKIVYGGTNEGRGGVSLRWGTDEDIQPTGNTNSAGDLYKVARADHQHLFKFPTTAPASTPDGTAYFDPSASAIRVYVSNAPTTKVVAGATTADVQPTGTVRTGTAPRYSFADHSHPTALLPQSNSQTPVVGEIRFNSNNKIVRWSGSAWVEMSVEEVEAGTDADVRPTKRLSAGSAPRFARADHSHPTAILPQGDTQTPEADEIRYTAEDKLVRWDATAGQWVPLSVETFTIDWGADDDVQPTRLRSAGTATRVARADHSHPTALLPQSDTQTPVENEIRYNTDNKIVRWNGSAWVPLSVETGGAETGTEDDVQPTRLRSAGTSTRLARADHSHPTAILPQGNTQTPVEDEIRYDTDNKLVRWDGSAWVPLSVETFEIEWGTNSDVQATGARSAGTSTRLARADHSHPTAILPQDNTQTPVEDEIRYTDTNRLVRWIGTTWVEIVGALPVPATPLVLPYDTQVNSLQARQLVSVSDWDNIGDATIFYRDFNNAQYRLVFARPLAVATASTPSGKNVWTNTANELVIKQGAGSTAGGVLWNRRGNTTDWSPVAPQLVSDADYSLPTDVGVLTRSPLTGTSGSRRWFIRGAQEGGVFRAPFVSIATYTSSTVPAPTDLSTATGGDGYGYFIQDLERVDIVRPVSGGNTAPTMLPHYVIEVPCRIFSTATDSSGHYVRDEIYFGMWTIRFYTTTSATTDLFAILPTIGIPLGIQTGRVLLYLHNPQSFAISTVFAVAMRRPTSTSQITSVSSNTTINIPANTTVMADLGTVSFPPSDTLSHHRSQVICPLIVRRKSQETTNANSVICMGIVIVPQRT